MITGSGLLAKAFGADFADSGTVWVYSAGVSNSSCRDPHEFAREERRLAEALEAARNAKYFLYFGTCSVYDPEAAATPYVQHKLKMEARVYEHPGHLTLRLPQVAGRTPNPHTLLNYLYARISRSESFTLWANTRRNIIDVVDVVSIAKQLIESPDLSSHSFNIANTESYSVIEIVSAMEMVVGKRAVYELVPRGAHYPIDTSAIQPYLPLANVNFRGNYLQRVLAKYYGT